MLRKAALALWLVLCICLLIVPLAAQLPVRVYRIGWLSPESAADPFATSLLDTFKKELHDLGYIEGKNFVIDIRRGEGKNEPLPGLAAELVALKPDVIVAQTTVGALSAKRATATIPIVMVRVSDPWALGLSQALGTPAAISRA